MALLDYESNFGGCVSSELAKVGHNWANHIICSAQIQEELKSFFKLKFY